MSDMGPGPCETCGEDLEIHTRKQLRECVNHENATVKSDDFDWFGPSG